MSGYPEFVVFIFLFFCLAGCCTYRPVVWRTGDQAPVAEAAGDPGGGLQVGERVRVTLPGGEQDEGKLVSLDSTTIVIGVGDWSTWEGRTRTFRLGEIAAVDRVETDVAATTVAVLGCVVVVGLIVGVAMAASMDPITFGSSSSSKHVGRW